MLIYLEIIDNNLANIKSNNSINWKYETLPIINDSFDNLGKNRII
jgi:hypothetical protein